MEQVAERLSPGGRSKLDPDHKEDTNTWRSLKKQGTSREGEGLNKYKSISLYINIYITNINI
jgi:hypothetical protein